MRHLASIAMFLAWLLYGAMPAIGMPSVDVVAMHRVMPPVSGHATHAGAGARHDTKGSAALVAAGDPQHHCPHGGKICSAPFCAGCLTTLPLLSFGKAWPFLHQAPAPATEQAFAAPRPAPPIPPPRA